MKVQVDITFNVEQTTGVVDHATFGLPHFRRHPLQPSIELMLLQALEEITSSDTISRSARIALAAIAKAEEMAADRGGRHET